MFFRKKYIINIIISLLLLLSILYILYILYIEKDFFAILCTHLH